MKRVVFVLLITSLFPALCNSAIAWEINLDFENGTDGEPAQGNSAFTAAGGRTLFVSSMGAVGTSKSAKIEWRKGDTGFAACNGMVSFPSKLQENDEIWARGYFYFKSPWDWNTSPVCKVLRIKLTDESSDENAGYHSIFFGDDGRLILSNEPSQVQTRTSTFLETDKWVCLELYVRFSRTNPIFRIWKDGQLVIEDRQAPTWESGMTGSPFSFVMSYWNGGPGLDQTQYVDKFTFANVRPSNQDRHGNYMIGQIMDDDDNGDNGNVISNPQNLHRVENP